MGAPANEDDVQHLYRQAARALDASGVAFWDLDLTSGSVYLNDAWALLLGEARAPTSTSIAALFDLVPEEERTVLRTAFVGVLKGEREQYRVEHRVRGAAGRTVWVSSVGRVVERDAGGWALRMMGLNTDITARKQAEEELRASEARFEALFRRSPVPMALIDVQTQRIVDVNDANEERLGRTRQQMVGRTGVELDFYVNPVDRDAIWSQLQRNGIAMRDGVAVRTGSGEVVWGRVSARIVELGGRETVILSGVDVSQRMLAEKALAESEARFRSAFQHSAIGMALLELDGRWLQANGALCEISGYSEEELQRTAYQAMIPGYDADLEAFRRDLASGTRHGMQTERRLVRKGGREVWVQINLSAVAGDSHPLIAQIQDITRRKELEAYAAHLSLHDVLTGLPNKRLLDDRLRQAIAAARRSHTRIGILFIDLDRFKPINDRWGHGAGDAVLRQVGQRLLSAVRQHETASRVGGDEFVVLTGAIGDRSELGAMVARLLAAIERPCEIEGGTASVSASMGLAVYPDDAAEPEELIRRADVAMYDAKRSKQGMGGASPG